MFYNIFKIQLGAFSLKPPACGTKQLKHHWGLTTTSRGDSGWLLLGVVDSWHGSIWTESNMGPLCPEFRHQFPTLILLLRTPMPYARFFVLLVQVGGVFQSRLLCTSPRLMCRSWAKTGRAYIDEKEQVIPPLSLYVTGSFRTIRAKSWDSLFPAS